MDGHWQNTLRNNSIFFIFNFIFSNWNTHWYPNNIVGYPDETRELIFDTVELARKVKSNDINAFTFIPYQGTSLRGLCETKNYLDKERLANIYETESLLNMPTISKAEIGGLVKTFVLYSRLPRKYWKEIKIAEQSTEEGNEKFDELIALYRNEYSNKPLALDQIKKLKL